MTRVAIPVAAARPAAIPLAQWQSERSRDWTKLARFNALEGSYILSETCEQIAADFATATPPAMTEQRTRWNSRTERFED